MTKGEPRFSTKIFAPLLFSILPTNTLTLCLCIPHARSTVQATIHTRNMTQPTLIITGASRGIGKSITLLAIQNFNANIIGIARSQDALQQLSHQIETELNLKDRFKYVIGDVTEESTAEDAIALAQKSWGGSLDGLVLNAG